MKKKNSLLMIFFTVSFSRFAPSRIRKGGGQNVSCDFFCDFGDGKTYHKAPPPKPSFGGLRKWDLSGLCPFPLRRMTLREQRGGGNRIISGGVQNRFWEGISWYVFPSPEFPPLCFLFFFLKVVTLGHVIWIHVDNCKTC